MPNHCENDLVVTGDQETLRAFADFARGPAGTVVGNEPDRPDIPLSAHKFIPIPDHFLADLYTCEKCSWHASREEAKNTEGKCPSCDSYLKDWYNSGGYDWCIANWGTKWGLYDFEDNAPDPADERMEYSFQTAWSPPIPVIQAMSKQFPALRFALCYFEGGGGFMGSCLYEDGQEVDAGQAPYFGPRGG